jgi:hypothetical protein
MDASRQPEVKSLLVGRLILLFISIFGGSGCTGLNYERQDIVVAFPRQKSDLRVLLVYEGLHVQGESAQDLAKAKEELASLFIKRHELWPVLSLLRINLGPPKPKEEDGPFNAIFREHMVIDKTELFTLPNGRLGGCQWLTVHDVDRFVSRLNKTISTEYAKSAKEKENQVDDTFDLETRQLILRACLSNHEWIRIEPGRLRLSVPASRAFSSKIKAEVFGMKELSTLEALVQRGNLTSGEVRHARDILRQINARLGNLADMPWSFEQRSDRFIVSLGYGDGDPIQFRPRVANLRSTTDLDAELLAFAQKQEIPLRPKMRVDDLIARFLKESQVKPDKKDNKE